MNSRTGDMSFSSQVKEEITGMRPDLCCRRYMLSGILEAARNYRVYSGKALRFSSLDCARFSVKLLKYFGADFLWTRSLAAGSSAEETQERQHFHYIIKLLEYPKMSGVKKTLRSLLSLPESAFTGAEAECVMNFSALTPDFISFESLESYKENRKSRKHEGILTLKSCCRRRWLSALFLCFGSVSDPKREYCLEWALPQRNLAEAVRICLKSEGLSPFCDQRRTSWVVSLRRSEEAALALEIIKAPKARADFEKIIAFKETRNDVSRLVNAENANLVRLSRAAVRQIGCIRSLIESGIWTSLSPELKEAGMKRLENPEASLRELCLMFSEPISRTTLNRRLSKLEMLGRDSADADLCSIQ